jgi:hypothetical protein
VPKFELYKYNDELFNIISIFSNGGHLGYRTVLTDTILKGDHLRIISAKFGWDWLSSFRGALFSQFFFFILILFVLYFKNYLEIDVKFIAQMCSISRSTYPAILK